MINISVLRHLIFGQLESFSGFGKKVVVGSELAICGIEFVHLLEWPLWAAVTSMALLGLLIAGIEVILHEKRHVSQNINPNQLP